MTPLFSGSPRIGSVDDAFDSLPGHDCVMVNPQISSRKQSPARHPFILPTRTIVNMSYLNLALLWLVPVSLLIGLDLNLSIYHYHLTHYYESSHSGLWEAWNFGLREKSLNQYLLLCAFLYANLAIVLYRYLKILAPDQSFRSCFFRDLVI